MHSCKYFNAGQRNISMQSKEIFQCRAKKCFNAEQRSSEWQFKWCHPRIGFGWLDSTFPPQYSPLFCCASSRKYLISQQNINSIFQIFNCSTAFKYLILSYSNVWKYFQSSVCTVAQFDCCLFRPNVRKKKSPPSASLTTHYWSQQFAMISLFSRPKE